MDREAWKTNGIVGLVLGLAALGGALWLIVQGGNTEHWLVFAFGWVLFFAGFVVLTGLLAVQPNEARVIILFGHYAGTIRRSGFWWTAPLSVKRRVSLRVRNFNSEKLKVNDAAGSPIEIAAVVVFRVVDAARAVFDVDNYEQYVAIQSETALRHLASRYPYDAYNDGERSLRGNPDEVAEDLRVELQERLAAAGVEVLEARLSHLAYAPEIASAMLQRQQAAAIVAARQTLVEGAVGMVQMALAKLQQEGVVELDEERKAAMISNLMVSIVGERGIQPVVNVGSLY
ncbi:MAG: SPFH domain-containing protein [Clostridia bacterium]|nr:SPFH domain-containing protein [Clostridia bacterium]